MNTKDYAIIIGLENYPGLGKPVLSGPEKDAKRFEEWVRSPTGGSLPKRNVTCIVSSDYPPPYKSLIQTSPTEIDILEAFGKLHNLSNKNSEDGLGPKVGRRLYIYMSGHGIAPTPVGSLTEESALLTANVDPKQIKVIHYHIPGNYTVNWFCKNNYFDEVFLFMDCCREVHTVPFINQLFNPTGGESDAKKFCAYATKWSRLAREKKFGGKVAEGIFTKTLLLALNGGASEPDPANPGQNRITFESLRSYLVNNMIQFIDPQFRNLPDVQEPVIDYLPADKNHVILETKESLQRFPVEINAPAGATGEIGIYSTSEKQIIERIPVDKLPTKIELPREEYALVAIVNGKFEMIPLSVKGIENSA